MASEVGPFQLSCRRRTSSRERARNNNRDRPPPSTSPPSRRPAGSGSMPGAMAEAWARRAAAELGSRGSKDAARQALGVAIVAVVAFGLEPPSFARDVNDQWRQGCLVLARQPNAPRCILAFGSVCSAALRCVNTVCYGAVLTMEGVHAATARSSRLSGGFSGARSR